MAFDVFKVNPNPTPDAYDSETNKAYANTAIKGILAAALLGASAKSIISLPEILAGQYKRKKELDEVKALSDPIKSAGEGWEGFKNLIGGQLKHTGRLLLDVAKPEGSGPLDQPSQTDPAGNVTHTPAAPGWFLPAMLLGLPVAGGLGWTAISSLMKKHRQQTSEEQLQAVEQEFEKALTTQRGGAVNKLASDYADGKLEKSAGSGWLLPAGLAFMGDWAWPVLAALATGAVGMGAYGGWKLHGKPKNTQEVDKFKEELKRMRFADPQAPTLTMADLTNG